MNSKTCSRQTRNLIEALASVFVLLGSASAAATGQANGGLDLATAQQKMAAMSMPFVPNAGQWDKQAAFAARTFAGTLFVTTEGKLVYSLPPAKPADGAAPNTQAAGSLSLTESFVTATGEELTATPHGASPAEAKVSYFTGNDAATHQPSLNSYDRVNLGDVFTGINVQLRATQSKAGANVEKIFTVAPQHDPKQIQIKLEGTQKLEISAQGKLIAHTGNGPVAFTAPIAFQETASGERTHVSVAYTLDASQQRYGFTLGGYDASRPLVIDPLLASTYLGGSGLDIVNAIAVHPHSGQVYVAGYTNSPSFPQTLNGAQSSQTLTSCFVSRYSADLQQLLQSTYLGSVNVRCNAIAFHPGSGAVYVAGSAGGTSTFPALSTTGAIQQTHADVGNLSDTDGFVALLSADLRTLTKATFFGGITGGGEDSITAIAVHPHTGFVHVVGSTQATSLPGAAVGTQATAGIDLHAFASRLPADLLGPAITTVRSTYIGVNNDDTGNALVIDPRSGDVFVAGGSSGALPAIMLSGAAQGTFAGGRDAFIARLKQDLSAVVRATYLGGSGNDQASSLAVHPFTGDVIVAGRTSSGNLPQSSGGVQSTFGGGNADGFVSRLSPDLTAILQSTYLGGTGDDCYATCRVGVHPQSGEVIVLGETTGGLPAGLVADGYQSTYGGGFLDAFIVRLSAALTARRAGTYLGGSGNDFPLALAVAPDGGTVYLAGYSTGEFPTDNAQQSTFAGNADGFVSRLSTDLTAVNRTPNPFNFIHQSNVPPNTVRTSNEVRLVITPTPPNNQQTAYVTGAAGSQFCVTNTAGCCATPLPVCSGFASGWVTAPYEFLSGDRIAVRHTSAKPGGTAETKLIISGTAYPFRSSTGNASIACNLDMNGDNALSATLEGLVLLRAMLGITADAVVTGTSLSYANWEAYRTQLNANCGTNFPFAPSAFQ